MASQRNGKWELNQKVNTKTRFFWSAQKKEMDQNSIHLQAIDVRRLPFTWTRYSPSIRLFVKINLPICMFSGTVFAKMKKNCIFDSPWILICISKFSELRYGQGHTLLSLFHAYAGEQFLSMGLLLAWCWSWSKGVLQKKRLNDLFKWKPIFFYIRIWVEQGEKKTGLFTGNRK